MSKLRTALLAAALSLAAVAAQAQNSFPTPGGSTAAGAVQMCLNSSGNAVPVSGGTCAAGAQVTGTFTGAVTLPTTPTIAAGNGVVQAPSAETLAGITPIVSTALESNHVIKASAGNFYSGYVTTGAVAGWLLLANSATAPTAGGAAIAPLACVLAPANQTTSISGPGSVPMVFSTGITMVFSSSGCLTNTASATAFFSGMAK